ncbi:MAG: TIGR04255 family protein [Chitinophagaceae bacterium]|nr:TIGR04255 family protein [Chitinophagaceae bacterium]MCA6469029.1 TIGR04255 family protein [Chitinophagaceae bacterium]
MDTSEERQLSKNSIDLFILRFDLILNSEIDFTILINDIAKHFDRTEKRQQTNYQVSFTTDKPEISKDESFDYVLTKDKENYSMTFSKSQNAFWFETTNYTNRQTYSNVVDALIKSAQKNEIKLTTRRIGMRFINNFSCSNPKQISKIFIQDISKILNQRLKQENVSRIIGQEEFNFDSCKVRVQYGIPNKFYPAVINNYDLLLDIDSYDDKIQELDNLTETIKGINHCAYNAFVSNINPSFLNTLK